jgi:hypothetical protein
VATNADLLIQARAAMHDLRTGRSARVVVDQNGERVEFTSANLAGLRAYIDELERAIAGSLISRGPLRPYF